MKSAAQIGSKGSAGQNEAAMAEHDLPKELKSERTNNQKPAFHRVHNTGTKL